MELTEKVKKAFPQPKEKFTALSLLIRLRKNRIGQRKFNALIQQGFINHFTEKGERFIQWP